MAGLSITVHDNFTPKIARILASEKPRMEHALAQQVLKDTTPFVPALTLSQANRAQVERKHLYEKAEVTKNEITWPGPYARYLYYGNVMVDRETGLPAFRIVGKDGSEVFRFRKGAKLKVKEPRKKLKYSKAPHEKATDHWVDVSKEKNMKTWEKFTKELVTRALNSG